MAYHLFFSVAGAFAGTWISFRAGVPHLSLVYFMVSGLLWFYSTTYKRMLLLGNLIVSLLTALVPFLVLLYEIPLLASAYGSPARDMAGVLITWVTGFSVFAFLTNLVREIVKDAEDHEGDMRYGKRTVPVEWGLGAARWIAGSLLALSVILLFLAWMKFVPDYVTLAYFLLLLVSPMVAVIVMIAGAGNKQRFHLASLFLKFIMVAGLLYMVAVRLILQSFT
jgi:4-hydroxybenzoate polyprenyltransferase